MTTTPDTTPANLPDDFEFPRNAKTGEEYKGGNIMRLAGAAAEAGYDGPLWAGFKQWLDLGRVVRKGEHGTPCMTVVTVAKKSGEGTTTKPRGFRVFHYDQTTELEAS